MVASIIPTENEKYAKVYTQLIDSSEVIVPFDDIFISSNQGNYARISDVNAEALLTSVLKELKKINLQLALMNDTKLENTEVE